MRTLRILVAIAGTVAALASCPPPQQQQCFIETPQDLGGACCGDGDCSFGACVSGICTAPWTAACAAAGASQCNGPYVCGDDAHTAPTYDCATCGCGGSATCTQGDVRVCLGAETLSQNRTSTAVDDNLDPDDYTKLFTDLAALTPITLTELANAMGHEMTIEPRTDVVLFAAPTDANVSLVRDFVAAHIGLDNSVPPDASDLDERGAADACSVVASASNADNAFLPGHLVFALVDDDAGSHATCPYVGSYASCALPLVSDCVVAAGRFAETVIVVDMTAELARLDQRLLVRAGFATPDLVGSLLDTFVTKFENAESLVPDQPALVVNGKTVGVYATNDDHARFVVIADHHAVPVRLLSFRAVWNDAPAQSFLIAHDIKPSNCGFQFISDGTGPTDVDVDCANGTSTLHADVDATTFAVKSVNTSG